MLHSDHLKQLLVTDDVTSVDIYSVPVLECSSEISQQFSGRGDGLDEKSSLFKFTPQRIRVDKDDEFFVVCLFFSAFYNVSECECSTRDHATQC